MQVIKFIIWKGFTLLYVSTRETPVPSFQLDSDCDVTQTSNDSPISHDEDAEFQRKLNVVGNRSTQFHVTTLAQQAFHAPLCVLQLKQRRHFSMKS